MGYNTTVMLLNDAIHGLKEDKDFGQKLYDAILMYGMTCTDGTSSNKRHGFREYSASIGSHCNGATVLSCQHADITQVVAVGGNCGTVLGMVLGYKHHEPDDKLRILKELADQCGYRLVKKPERGGKK